MNAADVAKTIQLIIVPVVLITACTLIQNAILMRYASVGQYMRSLTLERLNLLRSTDDKFFLERLQEIDRQIPLLIQRHRLLQNTVLIIYSAISIFLINMFAIAIAVAFNTGAIATLALLLFMSGTGVLLAGVCSTVVEVRMSHRAICYETNRILTLTKVS